MPEVEWSEDALLAGQVRLLQPKRGHRAGTDAVLLAAAAPPIERGVVVDAGAATGAVGLMIGRRFPHVELVFVERDRGLADLCRENIALNGMDTRAHAVEADLLDRRSWPEAGLVQERADIVATNPPFLEEGRARSSPNERRAAAHSLPRGGLEAWIKSCAALLKPGGHLVLIHRADRLQDCLSLLGRGFGDIRLRFVHPQADRPAIRVLLSAVKGSRAPLRVEAPLALHEASGRFTPAAEIAHRDGTLPL